MEAQQSLYNQDNSSSEDKLDQKNESILKKQKSVVWKYFKYYKKKGFGVCKKCYAICVSKKYHTSHLVTHLKDKHPQLLEGEPAYQKRKRRKRSQIVHKQRVPRKLKNQVITGEKISKNIQRFFGTTQIRRSKILKFFHLDNISGKAICMFCQDIFKITTERFNHLRSHIKEKHHQALKQIEGQAQKNVEKNFIENKQAYSDESFNRKRQGNFSQNNHQNGQQNIQDYRNTNDNQFKGSIIFQLEQFYKNSSEAWQVINTVKNIEKSIQNYNNFTPIFDVDIKSTSIFCHLCYAQFYYETIGLQPFLTHVQKMHICDEQFVYQLQIDGNDNQQQIIIQQLQNLNQKSVPSMDSIFLGETSKQNQFYVDNFLSSLKQMKCLNIKQKIVGKKLQYMFLTRNLLNNYQSDHLKSSVSLWQIQKPTNQLTLKSVIYIIAQNQRLKPIILGVVLVIEQTPKNYWLIVKELRNIFQIKGERIMVYGSQKFQKTVEAYFHKEICGVYNNHDGQCPRVLTLSASIISESSMNGGQSIFMTISQLLKCSECDSFLNFFFSRSYIRTIAFFFKKIGQKQSYKSIINLLFSKIPQLPAESDYQIFKNKIQLRIKNQNRMNNIKETLISSEIFFKYSLCFLFSLLLTSKQINDFSFEVYEKDQVSNTYKITEVFFDDQKNQWKCECNLIYLTGLPCPHICTILSKINESSYKFIDGRWISPKPSMNKFCKEKQQIEQPINFSYQEFFKYLLA